MSETQNWCCLRCKTEFIETGGSRYDSSPRQAHCVICGVVTKQERVP